MTKSRRLFKQAAIFTVFTVLFLGTAIYFGIRPRGQYYANDTFGIKIWHPKEWKLFDINTYYYIYKGLSSALAPDGSDIRLICAFSCSDDLKNLNPLITVAVQPIIAQGLKDLPAAELLKLMEQGLEQSPPSHAKKIKNRPGIYAIGDKKFVRYATITTADGAEWENIYYYFVKDAKLYIICLSSKTDTIGMHRKVFDDIAGSIRL